LTDPKLSAAQMSVVGHGIVQHDPVLATIIHHTEVLVESYHLPKAPTEGVDSVYGVAEIWPCEPLPNEPVWPGGDPPKHAGKPRWAYRVTMGGGGESGWALSPEEAEARIASRRGHAVAFWNGWVNAAKDGRTKGGIIIRCDGVHYVANLGTHYRGGGLGFGGRLFRFRMIADGRLIESNNVWYQGRIPSEYHDLLSDNATQEPAS
jgi:hypothetical protein